MITLKVLIFIVFIVSVILSVSINKNVLSPSKWFLLYFSVYFFDIYINEYSIDMHLVTLLIISSILIGVFFDRYSVKSPSEILEKKPQMTLKIHILFYLMIMIPVLSQIYIFYVFGGIESYLNIIQMRVLEFRGLGPIMTLTKLYTPIILVYFGFLLSSESKNKDWFLFLIALVGMVFINLMSGGRGFVLVPFLGMIVMYHFLKKNINIRFILIAGFSFIFVTGTLEVLRNQFSVENNEVQFFSEDSSSRTSFEFTSYGLISSELILDSQIEEIEYGLTYLTIFTNFVPRSIWPEKPSTGGVILTNRYQPGVWDGASNYATGVASEAMLNFGALGLMLVPVQIIVMFIILIKIYSRMFSNVRTTRGIVGSVVLYFMITLAFAGLLTGEFTNVMMIMFVNLFWLFFILGFLKMFGTR